MERTHGGDWAAYEMEYGALPLDFSASISPLGLPEAARAAAAAALEHADRYPDPLCRRLRAALSEHHGVPAERIVCGAGAADLIDRLARTLRAKRALIPAPTFSEYERALRAAGSAVTRFPLAKETGFALPDAFSDAIGPGVELVFLCQPNNPTGLLTEPELTHRVLRRCAEVGAVLVADECFLDFAESPARYSLAAALAQWKKLVILKAFTKTYAMAGLRLGYALCGDAALAERLQGCGQPWAVSAPAEAAGRAALGDADYVLRLRKLLQAERPRVAEALTGLGFSVLPGAANYLLFYSADHALGEKLRCRGILLRDCADFPGLGAGWYRAAIRTRAENNALIRALREV